MGHIDDPEIQRRTWRGDTWWMSDAPCPECGDRLTSNGSVRTCPGCEWATVIP